MGLRLQRNLGTAGALTPGQWTDRTASGAPAVCCPACGGVSEIEGPIDRSGTVNRRWTCPHISCSFRDWLSLEAWLEEVLW